MILTMVRRAVVTAVCVLALAGCHADRAPRWAGPPPSGAPPTTSESSPSEPGLSGPGLSEPGLSGPGPSEPARAGKPPHPVGWSPRDVPRFPPAPEPEPVDLPAGGSVPSLSRLPVTQPVAFLTIDDGEVKSPEAVKLLAAAKIPVTLFLTVDAVHNDVPYFSRLQEHGAVIEAHTITHVQLKGKPYARQRREICGSADKLGTWYGRRPVLFRPPYGAQDATTLRAAKDCGMRAAFLWKETVHKGKVRYQEGHRVQRGDIILMHFRPAFVKDFLAALRAIHDAGLTPALLEDYIPAR